MRKLLKILFFTGCTLFALLPCNIVLGDSSGHIFLHSLETKYTIIHYQSLEDLKKFNRKIDYSPDQWGFARLFSASESHNLSDEVAKKVDAVYRRAQEILGMRKKAAKVNIKIYSGKKMVCIYGRDDCCVRHCRFLVETIFLYHPPRNISDGLLLRRFSWFFADSVLGKTKSVQGARLKQNLSDD